MTERRLQLHTLIQAFENDTVLAEALGYGEITRLAESPTRAKRAVSANARNIAERTTLRELYRRSVPNTPVIRQFSLELPVPRELPLWTRPLPLVFNAAVFEVPGDVWLAYIPALRIEVVADDEESLNQRVTEELLLQLRRTRAAATLWNLAALQRSHEVSIESAAITPDMPTPKDVALRESLTPKEPTVLENVAINLLAEALQPAYESGEHARRLAEALSEPGPESVLLVGPSGVGKTAVFHELVRRREEHQLARTPFWATSGSRLVAGMSGFGMWQERCDNLRKEASRTRAILHLGNLVELMEVGKGAMIQQGIAGFLRPFIARGELLCVVECTPEQLPVIERQDPHLLGVFRKLEINEPTPDTATAILMSVAHDISQVRGCQLIELHTLETVDRLHRRYATYSAYPGRPLRFLRNLLADRTEPASDSDVYAAFSSETGLPRMMLDGAIPMDPQKVKAYFAERIIGQDDAIELVTDMLATVKAGLSRPRKPLASFLFVGPTGVGKTETSKALAEFLFNDRRRITRFDMSEYADPAAVQRLIGGAFGEEGLLTARMREQPFAVLLFDEFEKAHPLFFDLLLQVLGEARLTDAAGRLADFSNAVVIMTSNLGAEGFMQGGIGFGAAHANAAQHFTKALQDFVRPELLNRIDRVVPFMPLDEAGVNRIVEREIGQLKRRPGVLDTGTQLTVTPAAIAHIARKAYQPALGARPLKREIETSLLVPLADALNTQPQAYALNAVADVAEDSLMLEVSPLTDETARPKGRSFAEPWLGSLMSATTALRRKLQTALSSAAALRLRNEIYRLNRTLESERRRKRKKPDKPYPARYFEAEHRLAQVRKVLGAFEACAEATADTEDRLAICAMGRAREQQVSATAETEARSREWASALRELMRLDGAGADLATLWVYSHHNEMMFELARAYHEWAKANGIEVEVFWASREFSEAHRRDLQRRAEFDSSAVEAMRHAVTLEANQPQPDQPVLYPAVDGASFLEHPLEETGAIVLGMSGEDAALLMRLEGGAHRFRFDSEAEPINVEVTCHALRVWRAKLPIPKGMANPEPLRRRYDMQQHQAKDETLGEIVAWTGSRIDGVLARCIRATFERELEKQVGL
ncbi:MAG: ATP-dependent Clp protease ATP-binding subunit [Planctomycetes bacterium]|nr:ATP-dependent Clp protease ATP-binding subunit [Planctomycetota bacterium]